MIYELCDMLMARSLSQTLSAGIAKCWNQAVLPADTSKKSVFKNNELRGLSECLQNKLLISRTSPQINIRLSQKGDILVQY